MLSSLEIRNFRNLKDLRISSLGKINLFTGKNNTGKSSILEAISLYASKGDINLIYQILNERGENYKQTDTNKDATEVNIRALSSLFTDRQIRFSKEDALFIGSIENTLFGDQISKEKSISARFVKYFDEISEDHNDISRRKRIVIESEPDKLLVDYNLGFEITAGNNSYIFPLDRERPYRMMFRNIGTSDNFQFIRTRNIDREINGKLWDNITLTEKETYVIDALKIIEPDVERIAFIEEGPRDRTAVVKLKNISAVLPLKSMGDGINRILTIILALVNSDNGYLLLDEFENGLHYSVQQKLWEIIFSVSNRLNVQVFSTTHSEDCILSFQNTLNGFGENTFGKLIRLEIQEGVIQQVEFDAKELKIANEQDIETR